MDTGTHADRPPNRVLLDLRTGRGWGRPRLARELHQFCLSRDWSSPGPENLQKQIYRLESGRVQRPDEFYLRLYCAFFERTEHHLFGTLEPGPHSDGNAFVVRSHKFLPIYVGPSGIEQIFRDEDLSESAPEGPSHRTTTGIGATLYGWPTGVVVLHQEEELRPDSVADVAVWRRRTYEPDMQRFCADLAERGAPPVGDPYVLSTYWVDSIPLDGPHRDAALRLLCIPRVLTSRDDESPSGDPVAHAKLIEQNLIRDGFDHSAIQDFGIRGISHGFASWSGVVYSPITAERALTETELVGCELSVQAAWAYCDFIRTEIEAGRDPVVPSEFGWRHLRGVRSRLTAERPQETSQHRLMREAIIETSGLDRRMLYALEALKDCERTA